jgi:hypothetical protein
MSESLELKLQSAEGIGTSGDPVIDELQRRFKQCSEWEAHWRQLFIEDLKFDYADSDNGYQWPNAVRRSRDVENRPCLTMNITHQHNLQIINEGKRNKTGVKILPAGGGATAESAKMMNALVGHVEYQSNAQTAYSICREFQVVGGYGMLRLVTDYPSPDSFDLEIFIRAVRDPLTVYLDRDCRERDGSDARYGMVFDVVPKDEFGEAYPEFLDLAGEQPFALVADDDYWVTKDHVRVCEYFRKVPKKDKLLSWRESGAPRTARASRLHKDQVKALVDDPQTRIRIVNDEVVEWKLVVGNQIIDETIWPGKYIPLIRCIGEETMIGGILDRKGHTRSMKDAQRMYNYNASGQVEFVALQSKTPWTGAAASIEEFETYWNSANTANHSFLPFKHLDDDGNPIPPDAMPRRIDPPVQSQAFDAGMQTAFNQIMMTSGQWQNQMGMMGNERTGAAIQKRQDQGDTATYHFQDNFDAAMVCLGKQLIDLFPKVYDTKRIINIQADNGVDQELELDPAQRLPYLQKIGHDQEVVKRIFNPALGKYDVRAAPGAASGTKREETVQAMSLILTQSPGLTGVIGDLLLAAMEFPEAQEAAQRLRRMVPPQALGQGPSQQEQQLMMQLRQTQAALGEALQKLGKEQLKLVGKAEMRDIDAYKAETERFKALSDVLMLDQGGLEQVVHQLTQEAAQTHLGPILVENAKSLTDAQGNPASGEAPKAAAGPAQNGSSALAPVPGARQAGDGEWYLTDPTRVGKYMRVAPLAQEHRPRGIIANA